MLKSLAWTLKFQTKICKDIFSGWEGRKHQHSVGKLNVAHLNCFLGFVVHRQHCSLILIIEVTALILPTITTFCMCFFQEPLNSEDDVSDEEGQELFDTENVVVCQYDKVNLDRK